MPKLRDYDCVCGNRFEFLHHPTDEVAVCPACDRKMNEADQVCSSSKPFGTIIPMYKGSLRQKAGYVHTHGDRPAEKAGSQVAMSGKGAF